MFEAKSKGIFGVGVNKVSGLERQVTGMTDSELARACERRPARACPSIYWASEIYSLGKCLRLWARFPRFLPLFVYSDHGVGLHSHLFPHELDSQAKVHLTWNPVKEQRYKDFPDKEVIRIIHPWVSYRRMKKITRAKEPRGTLVFFMHGTPSVKIEGHDTDDYFEKLRNLPDKYQPVVICLHMHDVESGFHEKLRSHGFPVVTAGNTLSENFVDCFYDIVKDYSYATSQWWGTPSAYCVEMGIPFFLMGEIPVLINQSDTNLPIGAVPECWDNYHEEYLNRVNELFSFPVDEVTIEQRAFVESILGLDSKCTRWQISWILWRELIRNWRQWHVIPLSYAKWFLRKLGIMGGVK